MYHYTILYFVALLRVGMGWWADVGNSSFPTAPHASIANLRASQLGYIHYINIYIYRERERRICFVVVSFNS